MTMFVATPVPHPFGDIDEYRAEEEAFYRTTGWDSLGMVCAMARGEVHPSPAVQEWARHLDAWDCWLFVQDPDPEYRALEALEDEMDVPAQPGTRGHRRPQAVRSAQTRRSTLLGRLTYR